MIGLAESPGTDVDPACSSSLTRSPSVARIRSASRSNRAGQAGSYGARWTVVPRIGTSPTQMAWMSSSLRMSVVGSGGVGIGPPRRVGLGAGPA